MLTRLAFVPRPLCLSRLSALTACLLAGPAVGAVAAQSTLAEYGLPGPYGSVGDRVGIAGDVNGDGVQDLLLGGAIGVFTYSGANGAQLGFVDAQIGSASALLNVRGIGDLDGDGQRDIIVAANDAVRAWSRADGHLIWTYAASFGGSIGWRMGMPGDVNGDGIDDVAAGEPDGDPLGLNSAGQIHVISGATGGPLLVSSGTEAQQGLGRSMAAIADLNGDGRNDLVVGDSRHQVHGTTVGRILVLSSLDGSVLLEIDNTVATFNFAIEVADAGDLDGDGLHDIAARTVINQQGLVQAWSGATGELIWDAPNANGFNLLAIGDANGDRASELVSAGPGYLATPGNAQVYDGATGTILQTLFGSSPGTFFSIAAPGDADGDGVPELLVGTTSSSSFGGIAPHAELRHMPGGAVSLTVANPAGGDGLGRALDYVGDFDADGRSDIALMGANSILVCSAATGAILREIDITELSAFFSASTAVAGPGDLDADGVPDIVLGEGYLGAFTGTGTGRVRVFSGASGQQIDSILGPTDSFFGESVVDVADRNGDGVRDLLVSLREMDVGGIVDAGEVWLLSGATRSVLQVYHGEIATSRRFGYTVRTAGDIDGDGVEDLSAGSYNTGAFPLYNTPALYVLSGATGAILHKLTGDTSATGCSGAMVRDATGDGVPDLLMSEPDYYLVSISVGRVRLFSGADGSLQWTRMGSTANEQFGNTVADAGDVNGDGYVDVLVTANPSSTGGRVYALSGRTGATLDSIDLLPGSTIQTAGLASAGLVDAGGCADLLVGIPMLNGNGGARVFASASGGLWGFEDLGFAKAGSNGKTPTLNGYGNLAAGQPVTIVSRKAKPAATGLWLIGLSAGYVPFKQGVLVPSPIGPFFVIAVAVDGAGTFSITANNPSAVFLGLQIVHQFWWGDAGVPGKLSATNGLREIFK